MKNIIKYDTDEDQKTVNLKLKTVLFLSFSFFFFFCLDCCELAKKKKKLNHNQDCFQTEQYLLHGRDAALKRHHSH